MSGFALVIAASYLSCIFSLSWSVLTYGEGYGASAGASTHSRARVAFPLPAAYAGSGSLGRVEVIHS